MIRTVIRPQNTDLHLSIPKDFVGKEITILLYTTDEVKEEKTGGKKTTPLRGKLHLSKEQYQDFQNYLKNTRTEWNRNI